MTFLLFLFAALSLVNCQHHSATKPSQAPESSAQPLTSAEPAPKASGDTGARGPEVFLDATGVKLDGNLVAPPIAGKPERIDPLFASLKQRRTRAPAAGATETYQLTVHATSNVPTFKSAFQTAAFAGWRRTLLKTPAGPLPMSALVPMPPDKLRADPPAAFDAPVVLVARPGSTELWMNATSVSAHLPPSQQQAGLGITRLTPENDIRV